MNRSPLVDAVVRNLTDDLRKPPWKGNSNRFAGHCYVASEALFHLLGGKEAGWEVHRVRHHDANHWFLDHPEYGLLDVTAKQYDDDVPYHDSRRTGFLTPYASKRAAKLIELVRADLLGVAA